MRRLISILGVVVVMAAMVVAMAAPAFAANTGEQKVPGNQGPPTASGSFNGAIATHCNSDEFNGSGTVVVNKNGKHGGGDCEPVFG